MARPPPLRRRASVFVRRLCDANDRRMQYMVAAVLLLWETALSGMIIAKVPYTEIDWKAYMEEVRGYEDGERDYRNLQGGTGPLVYPAGFVHLFSALRRITGEQIFPAQVIFAALYIVTQALVMQLYISTGATPPYALALLTLSKRLHSIYVLRLFNDCWAMMAAYAALLLLMARRGAAAIFAFAVAVSIKMNVLLFAPGVLAVCIMSIPPREVVAGVLAGVGFHLATAAPFLLHAPWSYLSRAFEFTRAFFYKWTVNWKLVPEEVFLSRTFASSLLAAHLALLLLFCHHRWTRHRGGAAAALRAWLEGTKGLAVLPKSDIATIVLTSNFVGIVCARSLHYQFYSWYAHSLPFLLWQSRVPKFVAVCLLIAVEWCWNVFPATLESSTVLLVCHVLALIGIWYRRRQQ